MIHLGNHLKVSFPQQIRPRTREFFRDLLGCKSLDSLRPDLDLYELADGFVAGLFFVDAGQALTEAEYLKAPWLELKVDDPVAWKARIQAFGVQTVDFPDPARFYFQAPGGLVFRLAPLDGGI